MNRRRRGFRRLVEFEDPKKFFVIAMEGAESEPRYFEAFRPARESDWQIKLVNNPKNKSHPRDVYNRLREAFRKGTLKGHDEGWMVIDRDAWPENELNDVCRAARDSGFHIALSNPCFEIWLYLHFRDPCFFNDRHDCQRKLSDILPGYAVDKKGDYDVDALRQGVGEAIRRAKGMDQKPDELWPRDHCTRVYTLVEKFRAKT